MDYTLFTIICHDADYWKERDNDVILGSMFSAIINIRAVFVSLRLHMGVCVSCCTPSRKNRVTNFTEHKDSDSETSSDLIERITHIKADIHEIRRKRESVTSKVKIFKEQQKYIANSFKGCHKKSCTP